ncbi:ABC transporter permease subunit [Papillibacter cinnamivorans]|uniref:ABC-2 type transport system permease protein n=1 Tax=Papillibacter cinnamivorans DSM 12816 TaxID=1122930 RepID=A0A1W2C1P7_9FIRM|nr:ABC transporter permease subunit [Papillibacter cinnamivorans]SMC79021.1 ABC-2 type transport system permease protein [Papillibacter cinnamivorans DSM 12816]
MNIFRQELKMHVRPLLFYTLGMLAAFYAFLLLYDSIAADAALVDAVLANFPKEFKAAFGFADVSLSDLGGYLSFLFAYIVLIGAVFGMKTGISVLSEEGRTRTSDFLLSKPLRRGRVASEKLLALCLLLAVQNVLFFALALPGYLSKAGEEPNLKLFVLMSFSVFMVQLFFAGIGLFLSVLPRRLKAVMPVTLAVVFLFYIVELINESVLDKTLSYLTPFSYFKASELLSRAAYDGRYLAADLAVFFLFTALAFWIYEKKDIHA